MCFIPSVIQDLCKGKLLTFPHVQNIIMSSFKSSRDIQKKKGGPDSCFG